MLDWRAFFSLFNYYSQASNPAGVPPETPVQGLLADQSLFFGMVDPAYSSTPLEPYPPMLYPSYPPTPDLMYPNNSLVYQDPALAFPADYMTFINNKVVDVNGKQEIHILGVRNFLEEVREQIDIGLQKAKQAQ